MLYAHVHLFNHNRTKRRSRKLRAPRVTEVFHQSCANKSCPAKGPCLGSRAALSLWLSVCLSACPSHVAAALREGEDFGLGIVGRESVLAGLCVKEHRCETRGRTLSAQHCLQGAEGKEFSKRKGDTKNETLGGRQLPARRWLESWPGAEGDSMGTRGSEARKGRDGSESGLGPFITG